MEGVPNWLWPSVEKINPTGLVRFGRVLHWAISGLGVAVAAFAALVASVGQEESVLYFAAAIGAAGVMLILGGRAARYIFSGE